jgi:hypothetical protein
LNPGDHFEVVLTVPGVYDYCCLPHEQAGMAGRIVVGRPPFPPDAWPADAPAIPDAARATLPDVRTILLQRVVRPG